MNQDDIRQLHQIKLFLQQRQKELDIELEALRMDILHLQQKIDLLTINQLKINFDGEASTT